MTAFMMLRRASRRRRRSNKLIKHDKDTREDLISKLPDEILHHILSFLPTKDMLRTSVLSKRWQKLWTGVSKLVLEDDRTESNNPMLQASFLNIVKRILLFHDDSDINKLCLSSKLPIDSHHVDYWISVALKHNVKELLLYLTLRGYNHLKYNVFNSESLNRLTVCMACSFITRKVHLPNLRELYLSQVTFEDKSSTELFSNCPLLEKLSLINCKWENTDHITISIPTLSIFTFQQYYAPDIKEFAGEIHVHAENLVYLDFSSKPSVFLVITPPPPPLVNAHIYLDELCNVSLQEIARCCIKMLHGIQSVRSLVISDMTLQSLCGAKDLSTALPIFPNLTNLSVAPYMDGHTIKILLDLLRKLPYLEVLEFDEVLEEDYWDFRVSPCLMPRLKNINITASGEGLLQTPTGLMKYLLKYSSVLERVKVDCTCFLYAYLYTGEQFTEQLLNLPRSSADIIFEFLHYEFYDPHGNKLVDAHCPLFQRYFPGGLSHKLKTTIKHDEKKNQAPIA